MPTETSEGSPLLVPVQMLNEFTYCARLGYLEWVQGEFADSADTVDGRFKHRVVDRTRQRQRSQEDGDEPARIHERSVQLASERLGLIAKIDLVEGEGNRVTPVDYKRGKRPHVPRGAYAPELVQLCAQGLLLRDHGYECQEGVLYFAGSRERVRIEFDDELVARTLDLAARMREVTQAGVVPPPLVDSPKCSLVGICLPDEIHFLASPNGTATAPRPLVPARDDTLPLHVQHQGARVRKDGDVLQVLDGDAAPRAARERSDGRLSPPRASRAPRRRPTRPALAITAPKQFERLAREGTSWAEPAAPAEPSLEACHGSV